jgi:hypothetical protein
MKSHGKNDEGLMPDSTMENVMTKNTSCAPRTHRTKRVKLVKELKKLVHEIEVNLKNMYEV